ncbi:hypothetical protein ACVXG7_01765 [Enterobacter hormaechei]
MLVKNIVVLCLIFNGIIMKRISYERIFDCQEYLSPLGEIHHRALFGGYTLAVDEAVLRDGVLTASCSLRACGKVQNTV